MRPRSLYCVSRALCELDRKGRRLELRGTHTATDRTEQIANQSETETVRIRGRST